MEGVIFLVAGGAFLFAAAWLLRNDPWQLVADEPPRTLYHRPPAWRRANHRISWILAKVVVPIALVTIGFIAIGRGIGSML